MKNSYDLAKPEEVVTFLDDLLDQLNAGYFTTNLREILDGKKADELSEAFVNTVVIPLGRMRNHAQLVLGMQGKRLSHAQKLDFVREHPDNLPLDKKMKERFDAVKVERILGQIRYLTTEIGIERDDIDEHMERIADDPALFGTLRNSHMRLNNIVESLKKTETRLDTAHTLLNIECHDSGAKKLYEQAKRLQLRLNEAAERKL